MKSDIFNFYSISWLLICIFEYLLIDSMDISTNSLTAFSVLLVINLILQFVTLYKRKIVLYSFFPVFIFFYYIFHFGQVVLLGIFPEYEYNYLNYITSYMTDSSLLKETLLLCLMSINFFFIGGLVFKPVKHLEYGNEYTINVNKIGKKLFVILLPFRLLIDIINIGASLVGGYAATWDATSFLPGPVSSLASMWYACVPLMFLELSKQKEKTRYILLVVSYLSFTMITGNRGHQMVCLVSLFIVVLLEKKSIGINEIVKYGIFAIIGMYFIDLIYDLRAVGLNAFLNDYSVAVEQTTGSNIILETIGTFGETVYTPYLVVEGYGTSFRPFFGECFVKSFVSIIPDVTGSLKELNNEALFPKMLGTGNAIGGSFAGDMYYNFGLFYPIFSFLIGALYFVISEKIVKNIKVGNYFKLLFIVPFAVLFVWWVRDAVGNMTRQIVWISILILILKSSKTYKSLRI